MFCAAKDELESCQKWVHCVMELFHNVVDFYCVQPADLSSIGKEEEESEGVSPRQFFSLWIPFLQQFKQSWEKEQLLLARKKWVISVQVWIHWLCLIYHCRLESLQTTKMSAAQLKPLSKNGLVSLPLLTLYLSPCTNIIVMYSTEGKAEEQVAKEIMVEDLHVCLRHLL